MRQLSRSLLIVIGFFLSCTSSKDTANANRLNGEWELVGFSSGDKPFAELFTASKPTIQFEAGTRRVSGSTGCNRMTGGYILKGNTLQFAENLATTKMACPGYDESVFLNALQRTNRYTFRDSQLNLYNDSLLLMTFAKKTN